MEEVRKLELLLFIAREPLSTGKISSLLELSASRVIELIQLLKDEYEKEGKAITVVSFGNFHQLGTSGLYQDLVEAFIGSSPSRGLGSSTMEVLSIIAYKQPITRAQIEELRGVSSDYSLRLLLDRDLIKVTGVLDTLGNPKLYGTTERFLRNFRMKDLKELPVLGE